VIAEPRLTRRVVVVAGGSISLYVFAVVEGVINAVVIRGSPPCLLASMGSICEAPEVDPGRRRWNLSAQAQLTPLSQLVPVSRSPNTSNRCSVPARAEGVPSLVMRRGSRTSLSRCPDVLQSHIWATKRDGSRLGSGHGKDAQYPAPAAQCSASPTRAVATKVVVTGPV
jgi:hypothetical protein